MKGKNRTEKGITLIALIITIVILLILAVVAINSIQNDGIIEKADQAANRYNESVNNEADRLQEYLEYLNQYAGGSGSGSTGEDTDGSGSLEDEQDLAFMKRYILGEDGKSLLEEITPDLQTFIDDPTTTEIESDLVKPANKEAETSDDGTTIYIYAKYNNGIYKIGSKMSADGKSATTESVEMVFKFEGREGQTVEGGEYDGWIFLTDRNGLVEIISPDVAKDAEGNAYKLTLGSGDTRVIATEDLDGENDGIDEDDTAILSYNKAIETINNYCKEIMGMNNVRSVGASEDTAGDYSSTNFNSWFKNSSTVKVKDQDESYKEDLEKMQYLGIAKTTSNYWLASRCVGEDSSRVHFDVRYVNTVGGLDISRLWYVYSSGAVYDDNPRYAVRPVVINPSGI